MVDLCGRATVECRHDILADRCVYMYTYIHTPLWYSARNPSVLRRRKAERRTATVISSRQDWPSRGMQGFVDGQWRSGLGFSRILSPLTPRHPEIRRVLGTTYTRARGVVDVPETPTFPPLHAYIRQGHCPPVTRVHRRRWWMSGYFVYSTLY